MSMIGPVQSRCHEGSPVGRNTIQPPPPRALTTAVQLPQHNTYLSDCSFIARMLYKNIY